MLRQLTAGARELPADVGACATIYSTSLTMDHARVVLGFDRTKSLLLNIALRNHVRRPRMGRRHTWRAHSPLCGVFRKACTTGILHEVGQIGLLAAYPQQYAGLLQTEHDEPADALSSESEWFTFDHCAAGMRSVASGGV